MLDLHSIFSSPGISEQEIKCAEEFLRRFSEEVDEAYKKYQREQSFGYFEITFAIPMKDIPFVSEPCIMRILANMQQQPGTPILFYKGNGFEIEIGYLLHVKKD